MDNTNNANLLNITYGKYPKLREKNMTRNVNNKTVGNTHQSAIEMRVGKVKVKKGNLSKENFEPSPAALKLNQGNTHLTLLIISYSRTTAPLHFPFREKGKRWVKTESVFTR